MSCELRGLLHHFLLSRRGLAEHVELENDVSVVRADH